MENSDSVGIGSTMGRLTGHTSGKLHFNKNEDLINTKFKLFGVIEDNEILRIDFIKILNPKIDSNDDGNNEGRNDSEKSSSSATPEQNESKPSENPDDEGYELPDLVFRGKAPAGRPDAVEPFIGIFSFEKAPNK